MKKVTAKNPGEKLAHKRMNVLQLADALGNITEACKRSGMDRTSFYEWKRRFQTHGLEGLKDLPPIHRSHPQTTPPEAVKKILDFSSKHPSRGCTYISDQLKLHGISVSSPTVQNILIKHGLASRYDRWMKLEEKAATEGIKLTAEQVRAIEKINPVFRERHVESRRPGDLLCQDTFLVGVMKGVGRIYMQVVIDTFGSFAFGYLHTSKKPEHSAMILHNDVLPFYRKHRIPVKSILTDNGREYCGRETHPYEMYLSLNDIDHRRTKVRRPQTNGFVERFNRTALDEFFRPAFRKKVYGKIPHLQKDLDEWLRFYNFERTHRGYRNMGRRPAETMGVIKKSARHEG